MGAGGAYTDQGATAGTASPAPASQPTVAAAMAPTAEARHQATPKQQAQASSKPKLEPCTIAQIITRLDDRPVACNMPTPEDAKLVDANNFQLNLLRTKCRTGTPLKYPGLCLYAHGDLIKDGDGGRKLADEALARAIVNLGESKFKECLWHYSAIINYPEDVAAQCGLSGNRDAVIWSGAVQTGICGFDELSANCPAR
jgi:hypothetical protein